MHRTKTQSCDEGTPSPRSGLAQAGRATGHHGGRLPAGPGAESAVRMRGTGARAAPHTPRRVPGLGWVSQPWQGSMGAECPSLAHPGDIWRPEEQTPRHPTCARVGVSSHRRLYLWPNNSRSGIKSASVTCLAKTKQPPWAGVYFLKTERPDFLHL